MFTTEPVSIDVEVQRNTDGVTIISNQRLFHQGPVPVNLDYVVWNIEGSMSCTDIPFNDSSVIIIYHLLAISNGLTTCLVSVLYYHLPADADNQYRSAGVLHFIYLTILSVVFLTKTVILILCICITEISLL